MNIIGNMFKSKFSRGLLISSFIILICVAIINISCKGQNLNENQSNLEQPQTTIIKTDNIQYDIVWDNSSNVDVRIIKLTKDNETHDYVVATSYVGRAGGISTEHWVGCKCLKK